MLAELGPEGLRIVENKLNHEDERIRICAFRALRFKDHRIMEHAHKMANDPSPSVRREVALAMRYQPFGKSKDILLEIAKGYDGKDRYYVEAFGIGCTDKEEKIYAELKKHLRIQEYDPRYAGLVWRLHPASSVAEIKSWAINQTLDQKVRRSMLFALSLIETRQTAHAMIHIAKEQEAEISNLAKEFITKRDQGIWSTFKAKDLLEGKSSGYEETIYVDRLAPTSFWFGNQVTESIGNSRVERKCRKWKTTNWPLLYLPPSGFYRCGIWSNPRPIGGKVRIGRLFLRQSWTLPPTLLMDMKEPSF